MSVREESSDVNRGFGIGSVFGIAIRVDWSWLVIFALVTWNLGSAFGAMHAQWGRLVIWGLSFAAAFLLFASVLAHELAHSLFARSRGIPVKSITLFLFGGVSSIEKEPDSPGAEFLMAILGPVTSLVIGFVILLVAGAFAGPIHVVSGGSVTAAQGLSPLATMLLWLGTVNVVLGVFNLVPGFPLDGGRVLRALVWAATGSFRVATRIASWSGQAIGVLLIFMGISMVFGARMPFFGTGVGGLWLAFIGWFLHSAAVRGYRQVVVHDILHGVHASDVAMSRPATVPASVTIGELVHDYIMKSDDHAFAVMSGESLEGLVTLGDVRKVARGEWDATQVRDVMTPLSGLTTIEADEDAAEALTLLARSEFRQLPVLRDGVLVGLFRRRDIVKWLQLHSESKT